MNTTYQRLGMDSKNTPKNSQISNEVQYLKSGCSPGLKSCSSVELLLRRKHLQFTFNSKF